MTEEAHQHYKNSVEPWVRQIPAHWEEIRAKRLFGQRRERARLGDPQLAATQAYGVIPQDEFMERDGQKVVLALSGTSGFSRVHVDDFVISLRSFQGGIEHSAYAGCVTPAYTVLRPSGDLSVPYYRWLLKSAGFVSALNASTEGIRDGKTVPYSSFGQIRLPVPPLEEQCRIAAFLDSETARIDELVREQQVLRDLILEKRRALIINLVTQGVEAAESLAESHVPWIPHMPIHWSTLKLSHAFKTIGSGTTPPSTDDQWYGGDTPWVTTGELRENVVLDTQKYVSDSALATFPTLTKYPEGSIVIAMYGATIGRVAMLGTPAAVNQACCVLAQPTLLDSEFVFFWLQAFREEIARMGVGGGQPNISQEIVSSLRIPAPSLEEQAEIVQQLRRRIQDFDDLLSATQQGIEVLRERRSALISAAVTGQLDLRDWQPSQAVAEVA